MDHVIEQFPQLLAKTQENNRGPTPSIQLISVEQRPTPALNVVTRSGATTHTQDSPKQHATMCAQQASKKVPALGPAKDHTPVQEARCDNVDSAVEISAQQHQQASQLQGASMDKVSTLSSFLQSCMKLLRNQNALNELQKVLAVTDPQRGIDQEKTISRV